MAKITEKNVYDFLRTKGISVSINSLKPIENNCISKEIKMFYINKEKFRSDAKSVKLCADVLKIELINKYDCLSSIFTYDWQNYLINLDIEFANLIIKQAEQDININKQMIDILDSNSRNYNSDMREINYDIKSAESYKQNAQKALDCQKSC